MTVWIRFDEDTQTGRIGVNPDGVLMDPTLRATVEACIFTDLRGAGETGYWADLTTNVSMGSRLWELHGRTLTRRTLVLAERYVEDALRWMVRDGLAAKVRAAAVKVSRDVFRLSVTIYRPRKAGPDVAAIWDVTLASQGVVPESVGTAANYVAPPSYEILWLHGSTETSGEYDYFEALITALGMSVVRMNVDDMGWSTDDVDAYNHMVLGTGIVILGADWDTLAAKDINLLVFSQNHIRSMHLSSGTGSSEVTDTLLPLDSPIADATDGVTAGVEVTLFDTVQSVPRIATFNPSYWGAEAIHLLRTTSSSSSFASLYESGADMVDGYTAAGRKGMCIAGASGDFQYWNATMDTFWQNMLRWIVGDL